MNPTETTIPSTEHAPAPDLAPPHDVSTSHVEDAFPDVRTPSTVEGLGLSPALVEDILLRRAVIEGRTPMTTLAEKLHVSINIVDTLLSSMRDRKLIEYDGLDGRAYRVNVTDAGRQFTEQRSRDSNYAGPIPVPLDLYTKVVVAQRPDVHLDRALLERSFSDLVIGPHLLDQLGPAIHGDGAMFLYGPPGTGKSSVAERIVRAYQDEVLIPHCVEVDGQIVSVYDPTLHELAPEQPFGLDKRWVACKRPAVVTGGELHAAMLDLTRDANTGTYLAPLQMKANNGVLVIDDFGRQAMTPEALLNRWIVPLDRGIDYLTLNARKFAIPFEVKVVLSTNLDPSHLGDEAFFRRIHNKIYIGACTDEQFDWILTRVARKHHIELDANAVAHLRARARSTGDGELRAYLPGVVCELAVAITAYEGVPRHLDTRLVDRVLNLYMAELDGSAADLVVDRGGDEVAVPQPPPVPQFDAAAFNGHQHHVASELPEVGQEQIVNSFTSYDET